MDSWRGARRWRRHPGHDRRAAKQPCPADGRRSRARRAGSRTGLPRRPRSHPVREPRVGRPVRGRGRLGRGRRPDGLAAAAARVARQLQQRGRRVAVIPFGGSSRLAARGYAACGRELLVQVPDLRSVVVAVGSGATMTGLVVALGADRVLGVDTGAIPDPLPAVGGFASEMGGTLVTPAQLTVRCDQVAPGTATTPLRLLRPSCSPPGPKDSSSTLSTRPGPWPG